MDDANGAVIETWKTCMWDARCSLQSAGLDRVWQAAARESAAARLHVDLATLKPSPANPKARSTIDPGSGMVGTIGTVGLA